MQTNSKEIMKEETTGFLMKKNFIAIRDSLTVEESITYLRENVEGKSNIHYVYIVDSGYKLIGVLSIRELLSAKGDYPISDIMIRTIVSFPTDKDQEKAAKVFRDTDLVSIPVLNEIGQLVGVVHVEDILDVMQQETTEDFHKMASISMDLEPGLLEPGLMEATISVLYRKRIVWLLVLVLMNVFSGAGIAYFEDIIAANIVLVFFLPLLVDSGGNAGSQSATLVIRALATGDIRIKDWFKMFTKEILIAVLLGLTMGLAVSTLGFWRGGMDIAIVVSLTMLLIVVVGSLIGMSLPFIFQKLKLDPATASAPLITSICDIIGVLIYFGTATWFLSL